MSWWGLWFALMVAAARAAPAQEPLSLDLAQVDPPAPDDEGSSFAVSPERFEASPPWVYLLAGLPRDSQVSGSRRRRGFSVNPAVEHLQRTSHLAQMERVAHRNRNFLNCVGKRDPWSSTECFATN